MGHLSPYSKAELRLQSGCGKPVGGFITANCGDIQPDRELHMCDECYSKWQAAIKEFHQQEQSQQ